ncbi:MAG TPA: class I SAM-dependent methyltransferase [Thermoanaerobaculia bacterium]|nr:class I SAM-dependent methyltransferase [Thermoanaerobaculia bacterium]
MRERVADDVRSEQKVWAKRDSLEFFQTHRQKPADMYPSERFFLPEILPSVNSVLDIGCAAGGFSQIMKSFNPDVVYTGVDVTPEFIEIASRKFPESRFILGDGIHFQTPPNSFQLVYSTGILHLNSRWRDIVRSAYEQAERWLLCDFRLTAGPSVAGTMRVEFDGQTSDAVLPYFVVNIQEMLKFLESLWPAATLIRARGYYHAAAGTAVLPLSRVLMAFFLIEKGSVGNANTRLELDLPSDEEESK